MKRHLQGVLLVASLMLTACAAGDPRDDSSQAQSQAPLRRMAIEWAEVAALLRSGRVEAVVQLHDLTVTLTLRNGEEFVTREPALDAIFTAIREHAPNADSIVQVTE